MYKLERLERQILLEVGGVALGSKWNGGKTTRPCREDFSGYTNMVVQVDKNGYVEKIRVIRRIYATNPAKGGIKGGPMPTEEEKKVLHEVENRFHVRMCFDSGSGAYIWENLFDRTCVRVRFRHDDDSYVELGYLP